MTTEVAEVGTGRELDALVAERVMGWLRHDLTWESATTGGLHICRRCSASYCSPPWSREGVMQREWCGVKLPLPRYSTDMSAAWEVAEMVAMTYQIKVGSDKTAFAWWCEIGDGDWRSIGQPTAALAICKAALKAFAAESTPRQHTGSTLPSTAA